MIPTRLAPLMVEKEAVRQAYDELSEMYAARRSENGHEIEILVQFLDSLSEPVRILDAGCGQGTPVLPRISEVATAIGADLSRGQLRLAKTNAPMFLSYRVAWRTFRSQTVSSTLSSRIGHSFTFRRRNIRRSSTSLLASCAPGVGCGLRRGQ